MRVLTLLLVSVFPIPASDTVAQQVRSAARAQAAAEKQRASIKRQAKGGDSSSFFTAPWVLASLPLPVLDVKANCDPLDSSDLEQLITAAAQTENVPVKLIRAMIRVESGGRPCAVSPKGAQGLMQIMPATQRDLGVSNPFDPAENVRAGARYIKQMLDRYNGDTRLALAAYNAGPERVDGKRAVPNIAETEQYVSAITAEVEQPAK